VWNIYEFQLDADTGEYYFPTEGLLCPAYPGMYLCLSTYIRFSTYNYSTALCSVADPNPDPFVKGMDPDADPAIIKQKKIRKTLIPTVL
jgi:hypothetical protein